MNWITEIIHRELQKLPAFKDWDIQETPNILTITDHTRVYESKSNFGYPKITIRVYEQGNITISSNDNHHPTITIDIANPNTTQETIIAAIQKHHNTIENHEFRWITK